MLGVRLGTMDVTEYRLLPVSATETSALLRFRFLFLDFGTEPVSYTHLTLPTNREV